MKTISVVPKGLCKKCKKTKALVNELCNSCTIKKYGCFFPWLKEDLPITKNNILK